MFGGHHMAYNVVYRGGVGYPVPNHLGVEPKGAFTVDGTTHQPMEDEAAAVVAVFQGLRPQQLAAANLSGTFYDVVVGPVEYGSGSYAAVESRYPTGNNRTGLRVSSLDAPTRARVTAAIGQWVHDYDPAIARPLMDA
jgi:hypothetical protein